MGRSTGMGSRPATLLEVGRALDARSLPVRSTRFEVVAQALVAGEDPGVACAVVGRLLATDAVSLEECLSGLRETWLRVRGTDPPYDATSALLVAWSDATQAYVHQLSCADPMTGLSSLVHVRSRISELYLRSAAVADEWAMVVCEVPAPTIDDGPGRDGGHRLVHSLRLARAGQRVRTVFVRGETVGRVGSDRVVALVERDDRLGERLRLLRILVDGPAAADRPTRVWIQDLPGDDVTAALVLDGLAR